MAPIDISVGRQPCAISDDTESLDRLLGPGDVLYVKGETRLLEIGVAGGSFGHVVLVTGIPRAIEAGSEEAFVVEAIFPAGASRIWRVPTAESTSAEEGLHQTDLFLWVDDQRRVLVLGEQFTDDELVLAEPDVVELWRCPQELRSQMREDIFEPVMRDMKAHEANWSLYTAARAWLSTDIRIRGSPGKDAASVLKEVQDCWLQAPICTSIVITFWQRYLCKLAGGLLNEKTLELVLRWMPVKADRGLPQELLSVMRSLGWICLTQLPSDGPSARHCPDATPTLLTSSLRGGCCPDRTKNYIKLGAAVERRIMSL